MSYCTFLGQINEDTEATFIHQTGQFQVRAAKILKIALAKIQALQVEVENSDACDWIRAAADDEDGNFYVFNTDRWDSLECLLDQSETALELLVKDATDSAVAFVKGAEAALKDV